MRSNGLSRKTIFAGLLAMVLLGVFVVVSSYLSFRSAHQTLDPLMQAEPEHLPGRLTGRMTLLAAHDFEQGDAADTTLHLVPGGHGGKQSLRITSSFPFSPGLWVRFRDLGPGDSSWIRATGYVWFSCTPDEVKCSLVATCNHNGINYKYMLVPLEYANLEAGRWNRVSIDYQIPVAPDREDVLQVYFWYRGSHELMVDDIEIELYAGN